MIVEIESDPRVAGQITRYHTWPRRRDQSVGEHSWQIMRILLTVWPTCPRKILVHAVLHDVGEMAGDVPYPGKANNPPLKEAMDRLEEQYHAEMRRNWDLPPCVVLSDYEHRAFKLCENLEMWEWGLHEQNMGNRYGGVVALRMLIAASVILEGLEPPSGDYPDIRPAIRKYVERRKQHERGKDAELGSHGISQDRD